MADDRDESNLLPEDHISDEISERVRAVLAAAESAATAIRHEAEQQAQQRRRAAEQERDRFLENARVEGEALLQERMRRISELSDSIIEGAESLLLRMDAAADVKQQLDSVLRELARAAERLAAESEGGASPSPARRLSSVPDEDEASVRPLRAAREPEPEPEPEVAETEAETEPEPDPEPVADAEPIVDTTAEPEPEPERRGPVERLREAVRGENNSTETEEAPAASEGEKGFEGDEMLAARLVALQMAVAGSARGEVEEQLRKTFALDDPAEILNDVFGAETKL